MRASIRIKQVSLTLLWLSYVFLAIFALIFEAEAKTYPVFLTQDFYKYKSVAAREVILLNGTTAWLHGTSKGALVTIDGNKAPEGPYTSKDGELAFAVDNNGSLLAPIINKNPSEKFDVAALVVSEAEEDEVLRMFN